MEGADVDEGAGALEAVAGVDAWVADASAISLGLALAIGIELAEGFWVGDGLGVGRGVGARVGLGVARLVGCGVFGAATTTLAVLPWIVHRYPNVPAAANVCLYDSPGLSVPLLKYGDVTLWSAFTGSKFVHVIVSPTRIVTVDGLNRSYVTVTDLPAAVTGAASTVRAISAAPSSVQAAATRDPAFIAAESAAVARPVQPQLPPRAGWMA